MSEWLEKAIEHRHFLRSSVGDFAQTVGVDRNTIRRWVNNTTRPSPRNVRNLAFALGREDGEELLKMTGLWDETGRQRYIDDLPVKRVEDLIREVLALPEDERRQVEAALRRAGG